jgi:hypothetical protein
VDSRLADDDMCTLTLLTPICVYISLALLIAALALLAVFALLALLIAALAYSLLALRLLLIRDVRLMGSILDKCER